MSSTALVPIPATNTASVVNVYIIIVNAVKSQPVISRLKRRRPIIGLLNSSSSAGHSF